MVTITSWLSIMAYVTVVQGASSVKRFHLPLEVFVGGIYVVITTIGYRLVVCFM